MKLRSCIQLHWSFIRISKFPIIYYFVFYLIEGNILFFVEFIDYGLQGIITIYHSGKGWTFDILCRLMPSSPSCTSSLCPAQYAVPPLKIILLNLLQPLVLFHNLIGTEHRIRISSCCPLTVTRRKIGASPFFNNLLLRMKNKTFIDSCFIPLLIYVVKLISREQTNLTQKHENQRNMMHTGGFLYGL